MKMSYSDYGDFGRNKLRHHNELGKLLANPLYVVFVPVGMYSEKLKKKVYMVCGGMSSQGVWLTQEEGLIDKRISGAIDRYNNEILYGVLPESDEEFQFQNNFVIREEEER